MRLFCWLMRAGAILAVGSAGLPAIGAPTPSADSAALPPLDLAALIREAVANNPGISAARSRVSAARAVPSQAEAPPDPVASVSYTNDTVNGITLGSSEFSSLALGWTQEVPWPGKLRLSGDVARREVEVADRRVQRVELDVSSRIKEAYAELYRIDRTASILTESRRLLVSFEETARARYETGEAILENVSKAQAEITKLDVELEKLVQDRASAAALLNTSAGRSADTSLGPAIDLPPGPETIDAAGLEKRALEHSPEIAEMGAAVGREEARIDLAKKQLKPDLIWGAGYQYRGGLDPMVMGSFGLKLPLYRDRKQAQAIVQARDEADAARRDVEAQRLAVAAQVRNLAARVARAASVTRLYVEGVIPQSRNALDSAVVAYGVGRADFLTLLNDFSALLTFEIELEIQRADRLAALAALERLTAAELVPAGEGRESVTGVTP